MRGKAFGVAELRPPDDREKRGRFARDTKCVHTYAYFAF
jgi:hypothetical protein